MSAPEGRASGTGDHGGTVGAQPGESKKQRVDRELHEMLEEIRVVLPGLELLFGFLLILPFSERFGAIDGAERGVYLACFLVTAAATALLLAPGVRHRLGFRTVDKEHMLLQANRQVIGAMVLVAVAVALAVYLVISVVLDARLAAAIAGGVACWFVGWWFVLPLASRRG